MLRFSTRSLILLIGVVAIAACGDEGPSEPVGPEPAAMALTAGNAQKVAAGAQVPIIPTVRVLDGEGAPVEGATVRFEVVTGGGNVTGATPKTNSEGLASVGGWKLGGSGGANSLIATVDGLPAVTFNATAQVPANVELFIGDGQTAQVGVPLPVSPTVRVTDAQGQPVYVATVTFSVEGGGGSLSGPVQTTDVNGFARPAAWRLGPSAGFNSLRATIAGFPPMNVTATGRALDETGFNLTLRFISVVTPEQYAVFEEARARWEDVITGELANLPVSNQQLCSGAPNATETIDDVVIFVNLIPIDGSGNVLGSAGPCAIRTSNGLPIAGVMNFDTADLGDMSPQTLRDVVLHEMGHVVGIGSLWNITNPARTLVTGNAGDDPFFIGPAAVAAFDLAGGNVYAGNKVPVEHNGGPGTRDSHWREGFPRWPEEGLRSELMTGYVTPNGPNPLSAITIASLADMGYTVNMGAADEYTWTAGSSIRLYAGEEARRLNEAPLTSPILVFDDGGRIERSVERR